MMNDFWAEPDPDEDRVEWEDDEEEHFPGVPAGKYDQETFWEEVMKLQVVQDLQNDFSDLEEE